MSDKETLNVYAQKAEEYAGMIDDADQIDDQLAAFLADLPARAHVLDLGCGPGRSAGIMAEAGHKVTATDAVAEMVDMAAKLPGVTARHERFDDLTGHAIYDGVWANFSLLHAERADLPRHLAAISAALKPAGQFHIGMKTGTNTKRDELGRRYTYVSEDELRALLTAADMQVARHWTGAQKGLDGTVAPWLVLQAHKHA